MCLARPVKIISREGEWAEVEGGVRVYLGLLPRKRLAPGDYLLVHGELAINRVPEDEALKIIGLVRELDTH